MAKLKTKLNFVFFGLLCVSTTTILKGMDTEQRIKTIRNNVLTLITTRQCPNADLQGANLSGLDLTEVNLSGANLRLALLINTILTRANLNSANLSETIAFKADLRDTDLRNAILRKANLNCADLRGATIDGTIFG